jgi:hypothetical protein
MKLPRFASIRNVNFRPSSADHVIIASPVTNIVAHSI